MVFFKLKLIKLFFKKSNNNAWLITFQVLCQKIVNGVITLKKTSFSHFFNVILEILKNFNLLFSEKKKFLKVFYSLI